MSPRKKQKQDENQARLRVLRSFSIMDQRKTKSGLKKGQICQKKRGSLSEMAYDSALGQALGAVQGAGA